MSRVFTPFPQETVTERTTPNFFCSRNFEDRSNLHFIFPSLPFQPAHRYPEFRSHFVSLLKSNPDVAHTVHPQIVTPSKTNSFAPDRMIPFGFFNSESCHSSSVPMNNNYASTFSV